MWSKMVEESIKEEKVSSSSSSSSSSWDEDEMEKEYDVKPTCTLCEKSKSFLWKRDDKGEFSCRVCNVRQAKSFKPKRPSPRKCTRSKSARNRLSKCKEVLSTKSRRSLQFKKKRPQKSLSELGEVMTAECVYYKGKYYKIGDVVSMVDMTKKVRYGQIYGLAVDERGQKAAYLTWLKRRWKTEIEFFNPKDFIIDDEDELPRKLCYLSYIGHYPTTLFKEHLLNGACLHPSEMCEPYVKEEEMPPQLTEANGNATNKLMGLILR